MKLTRSFFGESRNKSAGPSWRAFVLAALLFLLWLLLSGKWGGGNGLLLGLGLISAVAIAVFTWRIGLLDQESLPIALLLPARGAWGYWYWLALETSKANLAVAQIILSRKCVMHQRLFWIPSRQRGDLARTIYANSITLTPGTVTVDMAGDHLLIHALSEEMCDSLDEMAQRIRVLEGNSSGKGDSDGAISSC